VVFFSSLAAPKSAEVAKQAAETAKVAREHLEQNMEKFAISRLNAKNLRKNVLDVGEAHEAKE
jgi:hypothetical protein